MTPSTNRRIGGKGTANTSPMLRCVAPGGFVAPGYVDSVNCGVKVC